ncbi:phosphotransferase [Streptomyces sp. NPDC020719]|uniref:phosphotransferase n=1 Tax=Streptomyces sp. NPDC020719 TaxID=3154896 RepID=UPI0033E803F7
MKARYRRLAVPAPPGLPRPREQADAWKEQLCKDAEELTHALPRRVLDAAVATVRELGRSQPDTLIHGDFHARNILRAGRERLSHRPQRTETEPAHRIRRPPGGGAHRTLVERDGTDRSSGWTRAGAGGSHGMRHLY